MAESKDFRDSFKKLFKLKHLGLWWAYPKSELAWTKNQKKFSVHYEIDMEDIDKNEDIISYFNKKSSMVDKIFWHSNGCRTYIYPISWRWGKNAYHYTR